MMYLSSLSRAEMISRGSASSMACFTLGESPLKTGPNLDKLGFTTVFLTFLGSSYSLKTYNSSLLNSECDDKS